MKKLLLLGLSLMMVFSLSACSKKEESKDLLTQIKERGYITVATEGNW